MSRGFPTLASQRAMYALLNGAVVDPTTSAQVPVYDEPPEDAVFPYIVVGTALNVHRNTFGNPGRTVTQQLDVWGRSGPDAAQDGWLQGKSIAGAVDFLLDGASLTDSDGWHFVGCLFNRSNEKRESDGITRHLILEYTVWLEAS